MEEFPDDEWELLGLEPNTAQERDVKRAYARLIKIHRPDGNAENFRRVHGAYQQALAWLKRRDNGEEDDISEALQLPLALPPEPQQEAPPPAETGAQAERLPPALKLPAEFLAARDAMAEALANAEKSGVPERFEAFRTASLAEPELTPHWTDALEGWAADHFETLARHFSPADVMRLLEGDRGELPQPVMVFWHGIADNLRLLALANLLLSRRPPLDHPVAVLGMARLAALLAFSHPDEAEKLANLAFPHLQPGMREWVMERLDRRLATGKHFRGLHPEHVRFWEHRIFDADEETYDWSTPSARSAISYLAMTCRPDWSGIPVLRSIVPGPILSGLEQRLRLRAANAPTVHRPVVQSRKSFPWWILLLLGPIFAGIFRQEHRPKQPAYKAPSYNIEVPSSPSAAEIRNRFAESLARRSGNSDPALLELIHLPNNTPEARRATLLQLRVKHPAAAHWLDEQTSPRFSTLHPIVAEARGLSAPADKLALLLMLIYDESVPLEARRPAPRLFAETHPAAYSAAVFRPMIQRGDAMFDSFREACEIAIRKIPKDISKSDQLELLGALWIGVDAAEKGDAPPSVKPAR